MGVPDLHEREDRSGVVGKNVVEIEFIKFKFGWRLLRSIFSLSFPTTRVRRVAVAPTDWEQEGSASQFTY